MSCYLTAKLGYREGHPGVLAYLDNGSGEGRYTIISLASLDPSSTHIMYWGDQFVLKSDVKGQTVADLIGLFYTAHKSSPPAVPYQYDPWPAAPAVPYQYDPWPAVAHRCRQVIIALSLVSLIVFAFYQLPPKNP